MGCDIHFHAEIQVGGVWEHYSTPQIDRNYDLFAKMAGVRNCNGIEPICPPKGLPDGVSKVTRIDFLRWGSDAHSTSWFDRREIQELYRWLAGRLGDKAYRVERDYWGYLFGNGWDQEFPLEVGGFLVTDARFVFWFDN